jgi:hypothetical protein
LGLGLGLGLRARARVGARVRVRVRVRVRLRVRVGARVRARGRWCLERGAHEDRVQRAVDVRAHLPWSVGPYSRKQASETGRAGDRVLA